ncbi:starvation-inducible DNA-binding protein [Mycoplasmopsis mustelae]|uniref:Starvation-inducible DNA-binding protein n=1 Tax=Mycoplasmopsis mustelae TaxID=171289 RepID=A0A4R7UD01_9BACT|nr:DNA starvation/stationary phase protection protein [Mycoplasmopsis mustelae]TDV24338.1 starvation-inducible DNA-binding protein [Mycoplasmopsis mustelae]
MKETQKLKEVQASLQVFYQKVNNIHWNVKGLEFFEIHSQTDKLKEDVLEFVDEIAEKVVMQGGVALGSFQEVLELSVIKEEKSRTFDYKQAVSFLVEDLKTLLTLSEGFEWTDRVQPIFDEVLLSLDKWLWQFSAMSK